MSLPPSINDITPGVGKVTMRDNTFRVHEFTPDEARAVAAELVTAAASADMAATDWAKGLSEGGYFYVTRVEAENHV